MEEAVKEIKLLLEEGRDYKRALELAVKAQEELCKPEFVKELNEIVEILSVLVKDEGDWLGILGLLPGKVYPGQEIKSQFRKKALVLHPDRNRQTGANEAFRRAQEACTCLMESDAAGKNTSSVADGHGGESGKKSGGAQHKKEMAGKRRKNEQGSASCGQQQYAKKQCASETFFRFREDRMEPMASSGEGRSENIAPCGVGRSENNPEVWTRCPKCNECMEIAISLLNSVMRCKKCARRFEALPF